MQIRIISLLVMVILTIIFLHNPFSGYITYTTKEYNIVKLLSKNGSGINCDKKKEEIFLFGVRENYITDRKSILNNRQYENLNTDIKIKEKEELNQLLDEEANLRKKIANEQYLFDENCFRSENKATENEELPFSMWETKKPLINYFANLSFVIYISAFITLISLVMVFT